MMRFYLGLTNLEHYLDDFIYVVVADLAISQRLQKENFTERFFTDCLSIPPREAKDMEITVVPIFGLEVDRNNFRVYVPLNKLAERKKLLVVRLNKTFLYGKKLNC